VASSNGTVATISLLHMAQTINFQEFQEFTVTLPAEKTDNYAVQKFEAHNN